MFTNTLNYSLDDAVFCLNVSLNFNDLTTVMFIQTRDTHLSPLFKLGATTCD